MRTVKMRMSLGMLLRTLALLVVAWVAMAQTAYAQTTGQIDGTVVDQDGLELPGATVYLSGEELIGGESARETNAQGYFRFSELIPGYYDLYVTHPEFRAVRVTGVMVKVGQLTTQNVTVEYGSEAEEITVIAKQVVDVNNTEISTILDEKFLERLPTGRDYLSAITLTAGASGGANPNVSGSASNENTFMIDGANMTDPVTGTFSMNFNYDAISQIEVVTAGYDPEFGGSIGGRINVITASGSNNLKYNVAAYYLDNSFTPKMDSRLSPTGLTLARTDFDGFQRLIQVPATVSGPLIRDKAWFLVSYQYTRSTSSFLGAPQPRDFEGHYFIAKLTYQPTDNHRISVMYTTNPTTIYNTTQGTLFPIRDRAQTTQNQGGWLGQARWQWFINEKINLDTRVQAQQILIDAAGVPCTHDLTAIRRTCLPYEPENYINYYDAARVGSNGAQDDVNAVVAQQNTRWRVQASTKMQMVNIVDPLGGQHDIKVGVTFDQFIENFGVGYNGNRYYFDLNRQETNASSLFNYQVIQTSSPYGQSNLGLNISAYAGDSYKPVSNFTLKYGARFEQTVLRSDTGATAIDVWGIAPGVSVSWDPFSDQKMKVVAGWNRNNDAARQSLVSYAQTASIGAKTYFGSYFNLFDNADPATEGIVSTGASLNQYQPAVNLSTINDNIRMPYADEFYLSVERQIIEDVAIGLNGIAKFTRNVWEPDDTNLIYSADGASVIGGQQGPPGSIGSNSQNPYLRLRTPNQSRRNYYRMDVTIRKIESKRWQGSATYSLTYTNGTASASNSGAFTNGPQTQYIYGRLFTDMVHRVVGNIGVDLPGTDPWTSTLGATLQYNSGEPLERRYWSNAGFGNNATYDTRIRPRGEYTRYPAYWELGFSYTQRFDVRRGQLAAQLQVFNLTNNRAPFIINGFNLSRYNRLDTIARQQPLSIQLGVFYDF